MILKTYLIYFYSLIYIISFSLLFSKNIKINGISAIIGNEIISDADIEEFIEQSKKTEHLKQNKCEILENMLVNKIIVFYAKKDQSIKIDKNEVKNHLTKYINLYLNKVNSKKELLKIFNLSSMKDLYLELLKQIENQYFFEKKTESIINKINISPNEVKFFFQKNQLNFSILNDAFCLAHIIIYPKLSKKSHNKIISKLKSIKKEIENNNTTFSEQEKIYSENFQNILKSGIYTNIKRGIMPNKFDAIVFNLKEKEISNPFATENGYHIVKLEKRKGQLIDFRQIFLKKEPNDEEIYQAKCQLNSIKKMIENKKISFNEAVLKFSNDNTNKLNGGILYNNESETCYIEKSKLNTKEIFYISPLKNEELSEVFEDEINGEKVVRILKLIKFYPEHTLNLNEDYTKIKNMAIIEKQKNKLKQWIIKKIPNTFIYLNKKYQNCNFEINWLNKK